VILSIEGDNTTSHADLLGTGMNTLGNWTDGVTYPVIEDNTMPGLFGLNFWPTIFLIRPNGNMILANDYLFQNIFDPSQDWVYDLAYRGENDVLVNTTQSDRIVCGSTAFTGSTQIKNLGTDTLKSATVDMLINGEVAQSKNWTGTLTEFKAVNVSFTPMNLSESAEITFVASLPNGQEDLYPSDNSDGLLINFPVATTALEFSITTDFWPEEISWELQDAAGNVLYSNEDVGPLSCDQTYTQTFELTSQGCHKLVLSDVYGDGLLNGSINPQSHDCTTPNGQASIAMGAVSLTSNGVVLYDNISYGNGIQVPFEFEMSSGVQPIANLESIEIYPNPAQAFVDVELNLSENTDLIIDVLDITGKSLIHQPSRTFIAGTQTERIDVAALVNGTYFVRLTDKNNVSTLKFTVIN
jgi:hypothetical protein